MRNNVKSLLRENARKGIRPSTQRELAARITELTSIIIGETYISRIANGLVNPGGALVLAIAKALGRPVEEVFFEDGSKTE
jgi:transcriptional regulator with XRE-family HTH domain